MPTVGIQNYMIRNVYADIYQNGRREPEIRWSAIGISPAPGGVGECCVLSQFLQRSYQRHGSCRHSATVSGSAHARPAVATGSSTGLPMAYAFRGSIVRIRRPRHASILQQMIELGDLSLHNRNTSSPPLSRLTLSLPPPPPPLLPSPPPHTFSAATTARSRTSVHRFACTSTTPDPSAPGSIDSTLQNDLFRRQLPTHPMA